MLPAHQHFHRTVFVTLNAISKRQCLKRGLSSDWKTNNKTKNKKKTWNSGWICLTSADVSLASQLELDSSAQHGPIPGERAMLLNPDRWSSYVDLHLSPTLFVLLGVFPSRSFLPGYGSLARRCWASYFERQIWTMYLWWSLCTSHLHACQVRVTVGDSGLCCCTCVAYFER